MNKICPVSCPWRFKIVGCALLLSLSFSQCFHRYKFCLSLGLCQHVIVTLFYYSLYSLDAHF